MNKKTVVVSVTAIAIGSFVLNLVVANFFLSKKSLSDNNLQQSNKPKIGAVASTGQKSPSVPKDTCGDSYNSSASAWYPVFLDGANVDSVKNNLCRDATKVTRKDTGKLSVQVASFTSYERAWNYAKLINASVGQPTIVAEVASGAAPSNISRDTSQKPRKWYEGGTLHNASALKWQESDYANKLATSADFVSALWQKKMLKPSIQNQIQSIDNLRPFAQQLADNLDAATKRDADPQENIKMYANQTVSDMALQLVILLEWTE